MAGAYCIGLRHGMHRVHFDGRVPTDLDLSSA